MTSLRTLFRLGEQLAVAHDQSAPGHVRIIPVIVDDLGKARPVLAALCEIAEGRLFDAADHSLHDAVPETTDVVRRAAVQEALSNVHGTLARPIVLFSPSAGLVDARFEPQTGADPSAGERSVLAVARAAAHRELDDRELAVIMYSESSIDYAHRRCVWNLAVYHLSDLPHRTLRTLIFVAEAEIDISLHCQTGHGFRFALAGSRLLYRNGSDALNLAATQIARHDGRIVFFLGAGFSSSSRLPLGNTLRDQAIRRLLSIKESEPMTSEELGLRFHASVSERAGWLTESELEMRADDFVRQLTLEQVIRIESRVASDLPTLRAFRQHHDDVIGTPGSAVTDFARVLNRLAGRVIVAEVNFDQLVETHSGNTVRVFSSNEDFEDAEAYVRRYLANQESAIPLLKFHGSIEAPETCVVTDEQMQRGVGEGKLAVLRALMGDPQFLWIYVGTSMRDRDLLPVLKSEDFARGVREQWVSPYLDAAVEAFALHRAAFWGEPDRIWIANRLITETADAFFRALADELT